MNKKFFFKKMLTIVLVLTVALCAFTGLSPASAATVGLSIYGSSPRVIEPWGIQFAMQVASDYSLTGLDDYGVVVISTENYNSLQNKDIASVIHSGKGMVYGKNSLKKSGKYYVATHDKGIYTFELDKQYTVIPYALDNSVYTAGTLYTDSMMAVVNRVLTLGNMSESTNLVLRNMKSMFEKTVACYNSMGITSITNADMSRVGRGNANFIGTEEKYTGVSCSVIGAAARSCEPWGMQFCAEFSGIENAEDFGIILISKEDYDNITNNIDLFKTNNSYIYSNSSGCLTQSQKGYLAVFEGVIQTYTMNRLFYAVPYAELSGDRYVFGSSICRSLKDIANATIAGSSNEYIKNLMRVMTEFNKNVRNVMKLPEYDATEKSYTISYNTNGGTGSFSDQTKMHGVILTLHSDVPLREGYKFLGWSTSNAENATVEYLAGTTYTYNANLALYAVWEQTDSPWGSITVKP